MLNSRKAILLYQGLLHFNATGLEPLHFVMGGVPGVIQQVWLIAEETDIDVGQVQKNCAVRVQTKVWHEIKALVYSFLML